MRRFLRVFLCLIGLVFLIGPDRVTAQSSPFAPPVASPGQAQPAARGTSGYAGILAYIYAKQRQFQIGLTDALKQLRNNKAAIWGLLGISFLYGIFHAAGPGHGKMVLSSYMFASNIAARRGIAMAFAAAFVQAVVAIVLVAVLAMAIHATGVTINRTIINFETGSYALIILFGAYLLWRQVKGLIVRKQPSPIHGAGHAHRHDHDDGHCGYGHAPDPRQLEGDLSLVRAAGLVPAMGLRPCTGAILVMLFAIAQGITWAGVAATFAMALGTAITVSTLAMMALGSKALVMRAGGGTRRRAVLLHRTFEFLGAMLILGLGIMLLAATTTRGAMF